MCGDILVALLRKSGGMLGVDAAPPIGASQVVEVTSKSVRKQELREFVDSLVIFLQSHLRKLRQMKTGQSHSSLVSPMICSLLL